MLLLFLLCFLSPCSLFWYLRQLQTFLFPLLSCGLVFSLHFRSLVPTVHSCIYLFFFLSSSLSPSFSPSSLSSLFFVCLSPCLYFAISRSLPYVEMSISFVHSPLFRSLKPIAHLHCSRVQGRHLSSDLRERETSTLGLEITWRPTCEGTKAQARVLPIFSGLLISVGYGCSRCSKIFSATECAMGLDAFSVVSAVAVQSSLWLKGNYT